MDKNTLLETLLKSDPGTVNFAYPSTSLWQPIELDSILNAWAELPHYAADPAFNLGFPMKEKQPAEPVPLTVYVGIEGCPTRCSFCGYGAAALGTDESVERSVASLLNEMECYKDACNWSRYKVTSLFIGGGTPSILQPKHLEQLIRALDFLPKEQGFEFGTEVYPQKTLAHSRLSARKTENFIKTFRALGGTRVNWAVQDFSDIALRASGRTYTADEALQVYDQIWNAGFEHINADFLIGTKGQKDVGINDIIKGVEKLAAEQRLPHRISANIISLAYNGIPDRKIMREDNTLVGFENQYAWYLQMHEHLTKIGLRQINRFDYGKESRYECDVISSKPRLAFGTGALGYVPTAQGGIEFKNPIVKDTRAARGFLLTPEFAAARALHYTVFNGETDSGYAYELAQKAGINDFQSRWNEIAKALEKKGLVEKQKDLLVMTPKGKYHQATVQNLLGETMLGFPNNLGKRIDYDI